MSSITRYAPMNSSLRFSNQFNRLFEPFFRSFALDEDSSLPATWTPAVDVIEDKEKIVVRAEVPGMKREDIGIEYSDGILTFRGERAFEKTSEERNYHRIERSYGSFVRTFTLPRGVDHEKIAAEYRDGVLEITVPKREEAKAKRIEINA
jgi:HSP20 family protein